MTQEREDKGRVGKHPWQVTRKKKRIKIH